MKNGFGIHKSQNQSSLKGSQELSRVEAPAQSMVDAEFRPVVQGFVQHFKEQPKTQERQHFKN